MRVDFVSLTFGASFDIFRDVARHPWPPVVSCRQLECACNSQMSIDGGIMVCLDNRSFVISSPSNHPSTSLVPGSVDIFEVMWVNPGFKYVFVLLVHWVVNSGGTGIEQGIL